MSLQARLDGRLLDFGNFQWAYYELIVANILIRSGFTLTLEDETVGDAKHCEFAAISQKTGTYLGFAGGLTAMFLWPAVALHVVLSFFLCRTWLATDAK
jgi:hypothetical protein